MRIGRGYAWGISGFWKVTLMIFLKELYHIRKITDSIKQRFRLIGVIQYNITK
ncbi:hypothetical protein SAMN05216469_105113 [Ruminococcus albus]|uniref:Uncharacterized protein n=1 Tax=Ruminococcus albus TaxID=1264 RepID=A0A1H7JPA3_RUMAL|nr:hypothetical protein SAMN05216469_105113 [Ruminococcus albus]